jgi:hypothetical protein
MKLTKIFLSLTIFLSALTGMNAQDYEPASTIYNNGVTVHTQADAGYNTFRLGWHWGWTPRLTAVLGMNQSHCKDYIINGTNNAT